MLQKICARICTKCSIDVNFQKLDFSSSLTRFNYNNSVKSSVGFISLFCVSQADLNFSGSLHVDLFYEEIK